MKKIILLTFLLPVFSSNFAQKLNVEKLKTTDKPRNVIFILNDDHRFDYMSFMKNNVPWLKTPNLDKIRAEGVHCKNAFVTTALC